MATIAGSPTDPVTGVVTFEDYWISDLNGGVQMFLRDVVTFDVSESENLAWFEPIGRERALPVFSEIMGVKINVTLMFYSDSAYKSFRHFRLAQQTCVLKSPFGERWFVRFDEVFNVKSLPGDGPRREVSCGFTETLEGI